MQLRIKAISALAPSLQTPAQWQQWAKSPHFERPDVAIPKLDFIPMMQRRRLSKFARLCCYTLHHLGAGNQLQMVFVSRFGDLAKTDELIDNVIDQQPLSPAQFGLSVHNAVAGQYSIFTDNKLPSTTISAGVDSFHMGMLDAITRLEQSNDDELIFVCTESITPKRYQPFIKEQQIEHSVAIVLSQSQGRCCELSFEQPTEANLAQTINQAPLPQALQFLAWYYADKPSTDIHSITTHKTVNSSKLWRWQRD